MMARHVEILPLTAEEQVIVGKMTHLACRMVRKYYGSGLGNCSDDIGDLEGDVLFTVSRRFRQFDPERGSLTSWLFHLIRTVASHKFRKDKLYNERSGYPLGDQYDTAAGGLGVMDEEVTFVCVCDKAAESLGETDRAIYERHMRDGQSQTAVGKALGMSQVQVSRRVAVIRAKLRGIIGRIDDE